MINIYNESSLHKTLKNFYSAQEGFREEVSEDGHIYESPAPDGKLINAVGAGDSMVAGFLAGFLENGNYGHAFKKALAAGSASAFSDTFATKEEIAALYRTLEVL